VAEVSPDDVLEEVRQSRRYRHLTPSFILRVAGPHAARARRWTDAVKETKSHLHQVYGAYVGDLDVAPVIARLEAAQVEGPAAVRTACREAMAEHVSMRERLPLLDRFYADVLAVTGPPGVVVDLACGLGSLALPWLGLPSGAQYHAYDVDRRFVDVGLAVLRATGMGGGAALWDIVAQPLPFAADVAFLLKAVPCLEQQEKGAARRLLGQVRARHVVVSYPTRSLGGAGKGMVAHYRAVMASLVEGQPWSATELPLAGELVFVVTKHDA